MRTAILLSTFLLCGTPALRAQTLDKYLGKCFGGKPEPCESYIVYDAIVTRQIGGSLANHETEDARYVTVMKNNSTYAGLEVGVMRNHGQHNAIGGTIEYDVDDAMRGRVAVKARARRWLSPLATMDVALGVVGETVWQPASIQGDCGTCTESGYGFTADATIGHRLLGVTIGADIIRAYGQQLTSVRVGGRAGGILGLGVTALVAAWVGAAAGAL